METTFTLNHTLPVNSTNETIASGPCTVEDGLSEGNNKVRCWDKWWRTTFHFNHCYFSTLSHLIDVATDIAVIAEFIQLWFMEEKHNNKAGVYKENGKIASDEFEYCNGH